MKTINIIILLITFSFCAMAQSTSHTVEPGQTFYSIAKMYNTTVADIKANNPNVDQNNMTIGTVLNIYAPAVIKQTANNNNNASPVYHTVAKGETLFGLAKRSYNVSVTDLKSWNNLTDNALTVGQNLIVGWTSNAATYTTNTNTIATPVSSSSYPHNTNTQVVTTTNTPATNVTTTDNNVSTTANKISPKAEGKVVYVSKIPSRGDLTDLKDSRTVYTSTVPSTSAITNSSDKYDAAITPGENVEKLVNTTTENVEKQVNNPSGIVNLEAATENVIEKKYGSIAAAGNQPPREIFKNLENANDASLVLKKEEGVSKWFELDDNSIQIYAMHASAPIGSALKLTNPINQTTIYVKVIDTLPPTAENTNTLMRLSSNAMSILKMYEKAFMVNVEYFDIVNN